MLLAVLSGCVKSGPVLPHLESHIVLLVVVDTMGAEHLGALNSEANRTPNLDRLAREGALFRSAYSPAPWTQPAVASLMTGRMPSSHGVLRLNDPLPPEIETLPDLLKLRGFETAGIVSNPLLAGEVGHDVEAVRLGVEVRPTVGLDVVAPLLDQKKIFAARQGYGTLRTWEIRPRSGSWDVQVGFCVAKSSTNCRI